MNMANNKRYWTGLDDLHQTEAFQELQGQEFPQHEAIDEALSNEALTSATTGRRDFLKFMGFSLAAATLAACETPVVKSIPYTNKPEEVTPGVANYYASTYYNGQDYVNVLVKTREGRPIFIKSNTATGVGHANVRVNASVMGLYDSARLQGPHLAGAGSSWDALDAEVTKAMSASGRKVVLTNTVLSPSLQRTIDTFCQAHGADHVQVDAVSHNALRKAAKLHTGVDTFPGFEFSAAQTVVTVGADFLGTWGDAAYYESEWVKTRRPENGTMSKLHAFESVMSLTGTNADARTMVKPSEHGKVLAALHAAITGQGAAPELDERAAAAVTTAANDLKRAGSAGLVVAGANDVDAQLVAAAINTALGADGTTVKYSGDRLFAGDDSAFAKLVQDMNAGRVSAMVMHGTNPAYHAADKEAFRTGLAKVKFSVSTSWFADESASRCTAMAPDHHWLENWMDLRIGGTRVDLAQPTIQPLFDTRAAGESFLAWAGQPAAWYDVVRTTHSGGYTSEAMYNDASWNGSLHDGFYMTGEAMPGSAAALGNDVSASVRQLSTAKGGAIELALYQKQAIGFGDQAGNPMLQETPDPVSKVTWDNYVTMARVDMEAMGLNTYIAQRDKASVVKVTVNGQSVELPAFMQPGQTPGTVGIALGYGRGDGGENIGRAAFATGENGEHLQTAEGKPMPIGANVFGLATVSADGSPRYDAYDVTVESTGAEFALAATQIHNTVMDRDSVVKETTFDSYLAEASKPKGRASWNKNHTLTVHEDINGDGVIDASDGKKTSAFDLWKSHPVEGVGHRWGMTIDLTTCTGCSACVTACHIENNVPVVGKDEVRRHRDMHWMRIDRYYASDWSQERGAEEGVGVISSYTKMEDPSANPQTVHMPMMCQHCNHAPCETVCPVAATTHSNEGLNQMTYNRCIGTRYCANNCPYKVRRFNWFNYQGYAKFQHTNPSQDSLTRMVLNPDVTVRARGVIEKCSMCVQRIQEGKLSAKKAGTPVEDGTVLTACAEACPTHAINFGDFNDEASKVSTNANNNRSYHALEEVGIQPNIFYMTKVRNTESNEA
jgi:molybdopterin-containing oxidoreductase family iron-sulfur binding subunit